MARIESMTVAEAEEWYAALYPERMAALRKRGAPRQVKSLRAKKA
ncbi:hypothetical protein [Desulfovibrio sp. SGI.169]